MSSTFFGLTIAGSGLNAFSAAINTTANNVANVDTEGYSKQVVNKEAADALRVYQKYGSTSAGVVASSITQMRDQYYDVKYWTNEGNYGYYDKKEYYMEQIEAYFNDKGSDIPGFSTIFADMFNSLENIQDAAGSSEARTTFVSEAQKFVTYFNQTAARLENVQIDINDEIKSTVDQVNAIAQKIALLNKQINVIEMENGHANDLRDSRALLVDQLSKIINVDVQEEKVANSNHPDMYTGATTFKVKINGQTLVDTYSYRELACVTRDGKVNQSDVDGLYDIYWKDTIEYRGGNIVTGTGNPLNVLANNQSGSLKAMFEMRDGADGLNLRGSVVLSDVNEATGVMETLSDSSQITILAPSYMDEVEEMNMPASGVITVNNTKLEYETFTAQYRTQMIDIYQPELDADNKLQVDEDGKIIYSQTKTSVEAPILYDENGDEIPYDEYGNPTKGGGSPRVKYYTFMLKDGISKTTLSKLDGQATIGTTVYTKGVPYYQNQMNQFLRSFAKRFNDVINQGQDLDGKAGESVFVAHDATDGTINYQFAGQQTYTNVGQREDSTESPTEVIASFTKDLSGNRPTDQYGNPVNVYVTKITCANYKQLGFSPTDALKGENDYMLAGYSRDNYYQMTAKSVDINESIARDVTKFAATTNVNNGVDNNDLIASIAKLESNVKMFRGVTADKFLQCIYADVTVDAQESKVFTDNFKSMQTQIDKQRQSVSGVDEDEEAMNLVKYQNAYNLSSKIISTLAEMYDQLILRTGV